MEELLKRAVRKQDVGCGRVPPDRDGEHRLSR